MAARRKKKPRHKAVSLDDWGTLAKMICDNHMRLSVQAYTMGDARARRIYRTSVYRMIHLMPLDVVESLRWAIAAIDARPHIQIMGSNNAVIMSDARKRLREELKRVLGSCLGVYARIWMGGIRSEKLTACYDDEALLENTDERMSLIMRAVGATEPIILARDPTPKEMNSLRRKDPYVGLFASLGQPIPDLRREDYRESVGLPKMKRNPYRDPKTGRLAKRPTTPPTQI